MSDQKTEKAQITHGLAEALGGLIRDQLACIEERHRKALAQAWEEGIEAATRIFASNADQVLPFLRERVLPPNPYRVFPPDKEVT